MWVLALIPLASQLITSANSVNRGDLQPLYNLRLNSYQIADFQVYNPQESSLTDYYGISSDSTSNNYDYIFGLKDQQYHDYYTETVFNSTQKCGPEDFHCPKYQGSYGYCITNVNISSQICNGVYDCLNGADEALCTHWNNGIKDVMLLKKSTGFQCNNGLFIPNLWKCDGYCDCNQNCEDENNCGINSKSSEKLCRSDATIRCDGWLDCLDGSDENFCSNIYKNVKGNYKFKNKDGSPNGKGKAVWKKCNDQSKSQQC